MSKLQLTAAHGNTLQDTARHCATLPDTARHCNTLQETARRCNTLQCTATHFNTHYTNPLMQLGSRGQHALSLERLKVAVFHCLPRIVVLRGLSVLFCGALWQIHRTPLRIYRAFLWRICRALAWNQSALLRIYRAFVQRCQTHLQIQNAPLQRLRALFGTICVYLHLASLLCF